MSKFIELNHPILDGMKPYPGLPAPKIGAFLDHQQSRLRYKNKASFYLGRVDMVCNVGTYLDAPFHRYPDGKDLAELPLESLAGVPGVVLDLSPRASGAIAPPDILTDWHLEDLAVLLRTGWDRRWGTDDYWEPGPFLTEETVDRLVESKPTIVGVDFWNIDSPLDPVRPAHTKLLNANVPIVEHLTNLAALPPRGFRFYAIPPRIVRGASFPVRAFAELES